MIDNCPQCGSHNRCQKSSNCWCLNYPQILDLSDKICWCSTCLKKAIIDKIALLTKAPTTEQMDKIKSLGAVSNPIENIDYFTNEDGLMVLTKWYHLRRGSCCNSGCQECPF